MSMQSVKRLAKLCPGTAGTFAGEFKRTQLAVLKGLTTTPPVKAVMRGMTQRAMLEKLTQDFFFDDS